MELSYFSLLCQSRCQLNVGQKIPLRIPNHFSTEEGKIERRAQYTHIYRREKNVATHLMIIRCIVWTFGTQRKRLHTIECVSVIVLTIAFPFRLNERLLVLFRSRDDTLIKSTQEMGYRPQPKHIRHIFAPAKCVLGHSQTLFGSVRCKIEIQFFPQYLRDTIHSTICLHISF